MKIKALIHLFVSDVKNFWSSLQAVV